VGGGLTNGVNGNLVGVADAKLGPLQDNGGPTKTMALLAGSPALDAGDNGLVPSDMDYDQRGTGFARIVNGTVDIGAYENQQPVATAMTVTTLEHAPKVLTLSGSDPDGATVGFVITTLPLHGDLYEGSGTSGTLITGTNYRLTGNQVTYVPRDHWNSSGGTPDTFTFQADDGIVLSTPAVVTVNVTAVNDAPLRTAGTLGPINVKAGGSNRVSLGLGGLTYGPGGGADQAGQTLTYRVTAVPDFGKGQIFLANGEQVLANRTYTLAQIQGMTFKPTGNALGPLTFSFTVTDNGGTANGGADMLTETLTINVLPKN
jgi:hypothetical protein